MIRKLYIYRKKSWNVALDNSLDSERTLLFVFGPSETEQINNALDEIFQVFPNSTIIGSSGAGQIFDMEVSDHDLVVAIIKFDHTNFKTVSYPITNMRDSREIGKTLGQELMSEQLKSIFVLTDGLLVNGSQFTDGINDSISNSVIVTGGMAGDGDRFKKTWVIHNKQLSSGYIVAVGFYGNHIRTAYGCEGGWDRLGIERKVTKSEHNVLYEIDGQPALDLYKNYLGDKADGLPASGLLFPLELREINSDIKVVRSILAVNETEKSITFAGDLPEGSYVTLMKANFDRLIDGAYSAANMVDLSYYNNSAILCIAISCVGRRLVLKQRTEEELEATLDTLPDGVRQIGFYSYGEISPCKHTNCELHNQTMTITMIWENDAPLT